VPAAGELRVLDEILVRLHDARRHAGRGHFVFLEHPELGSHTVQRSDFRLSRAEPSPAWPAPDIGAHTVEVCEGLLGMSRAEIDALVADDVLEVATAAEIGEEKRPQV
jgi:crotonobetainyl-CoA:carnitine CoA-transferase CaiB-like acyl-CoA transferase